MREDTALGLGRGENGPRREGISRLKGAFLIDIVKVRADPSQPRREFDVNELAELTASIVERGIRQPLRVWHATADDAYQIVSGERRFRAAQAAGLTQVPCIIDDAPVGRMTPDRRIVLTDQIVENWQRAELHPYDLSDALCDLRDEHGLSQNDIAKVTGKPKSEISRFLAMQRVVPEVQSTVRGDQTGRYSRRHVVALAKLAADQQPNMAGRILDESLTAEQTEREVAKRLKSRLGGGRRGPTYTIREFAVGSTRIRMTFRKDSVTSEDVLAVLTGIRRQVNLPKGQ